METVAIFALSEKSLAYAVRDRLLTEGRLVWLELNADPELTVSVKVENWSKEDALTTP
jgi:hypothetical protein